jgi:hypothetical protein
MALAVIVEDLTSTTVLILTALQGHMLMRKEGNYMIYTGIGSRDVTSHEFSLMVAIAQRFARDGWKLRSGGAGGADTAFEQGCAYKQGEAEIFIPWNKFGSKLINPNSKRYIPSGDNFKIAREYLIDNDIIPWFDRMKQGAQKLHGRNYYQVIGFGDKSDLMAYCADDDKNGVPAGGTRTAILLAQSFSIPTYNIRDVVQRKELLELIGLEE